MRLLVSAPISHRALFTFRTITLPLAAMAFSSILFACADGKKHTVAAPVQGPREATLKGAASEAGVDPRYLMTAAYVQSNFATDLKEKRHNPKDSGRESVFGMPLAEMPAGSPESLGERARILAGRIAAEAKKKAPAGPFDWLLCTAIAIVGGAEKDPNVRDFQVRLVLLQLIDAFNNGFAVTLPEGEHTVAPPASDRERVNVKTLDSGRSRYVTGFRFDRDLAAQVFLPGSAKVVVDTRAPDQFPRVIVRQCPASAITCLDHFRKTTATGAHFVAYKTARGDLELAQLQELASDVSWYGKPQNDSIVVVLAGASGVATQSHRIDWFDWEDYVALRRVVTDVLTQTARTLKVSTKDWMQADGVSFRPAFLSGAVSEYFVEPKETAGPAGAAEFLLPKSWDTGLFREILGYTGEPRMQSQIRVDSPREGQTFAGFRAYFSFYPDPGAAEIDVFQDRADGKPGEPWDLIFKQDYSSTTPRFDFNHEFRRTGLTGNAERAVKIVSRAANGKILGSRVVRFVVSGIAQTANAK